MMAPLATLGLLVSSFCLLQQMLMVMGVKNESFTENLYISPLTDGKVYSHFTFATEVGNGYSCNSRIDYALCCMSVF
jgi:hypothetical protein